MWPFPRHARVPATVSAQTMSAEDMLEAQIRAVGLPAPVRELVFAPPRRWRFDLAWPDPKVACEVEGATWAPVSRHTRGTGFHKDLEKYNRAAVNGWMVVRVTTNMVGDGRALEWIEQALAARREENDSRPSQAVGRADPVDDPAGVLPPGGPQASGGVR